MPSTKHGSGMHTLTGTQTRELTGHPKADEESCGGGFSRRAAKSNLFSIVLISAASVIGRMDSWGRRWHCQLARWVLEDCRITSQRSSLLAKTSAENHLDLGETAVEGGSQHWKRRHDWGKQTNRKAALSIHPGWGGHECATPTYKHMYLFKHEDQ